MYESFDIPGLWGMGRQYMEGKRGFYWKMCDDSGRYSTSMWIEWMKSIDATCESVGYLQ